MSVFTVNSFQVPNALVDAQMSKMSGNALKCLMYIIRQTRGWHKQADAIAISAFVQKCGMSKNTALSSIKELVELGLVKQVRGTASTALNNYALTAIFDAGEVNSASAKIEPVQILHGANSDSASSNFAPSSANFEPVASAKFAPTKDILFKDTIQKTNTKDSAHAKNETDFDEFWKAYPKKDAKEAARKAFEKLKPDKPLFQAMLDCLAWRCQSEDWRKERGKYVPLAATWLNGKRWQDEPPKAAVRQEYSLVNDVKNHYEVGNEQTLLG